MADSAASRDDPSTRDAYARDAMPAGAADERARAGELEARWAWIAGEDSSRRLGIRQAISWTMRALASLKLTITLFALAIFLVLAGTLAQWHKDIWQVVHEYFRTPIAWIDLKDFFPKAFFPNGPTFEDGTRYRFPFPGGFLIGGLMALNLLAAHAMRFKVNARGLRAAAGLVVVAAGVLITWGVIASGSSSEGIQDAPSLSWTTVWRGIKAALVVLLALLVVALVMLDRRRRRQWWTLAASANVLGVLLVWLLFFFGTEMPLADESMRILWQLIKATLAGLVLLAGCMLLFNKRAGIVLLHGGIGLIMANELIVHWLHVEGHMHIREGETVNYVQDIRTVELAVVDGSDPDHDHVVVVPRAALLPEEQHGNTVAGWLGSWLRQSQPQVHRIVDKRLPFEIELVEFLQNSRLTDGRKGKRNPATAGAGLNFVAESLRPGAGSDSGGKVDATSAYLKLSRGPDKPLGTYLVGIELNPQRIEVDGKTYEVQLRFKRIYKPYSFHLVEVRKDDYVGTATPRNYSSAIRLVDPSRNEDRDDVLIWMNNPLRYAGETFYQSDYHVYSDGTKATTLQVVTNTGWMLPYVGCMIVVVGMLSQFSISLLRFVDRRSRLPVAEVVPLRSRRERKAEKADRRHGNGAQHEPDDWPLPRVLGLIVPVIATLLAAGWVASSVRPPKTSEGAMDLHAFGRLPVIDQGRPKPLDTLARNTLRNLSRKDSFVLHEGKDTKGEAVPLRGEAESRQPAIRWLLDVIADPRAAETHRVFYIEHEDVRTTLKLPRRKGYLYSLGEFAGQIGQFEEQVKRADELQRQHPERLTLYQKKVLELAKKLQLYIDLRTTFEWVPMLPALPSRQQIDEQPALAERQVLMLQLLLGFYENQRTSAQRQGERAPGRPLIVPGSSAGEWQPLAIGWFEDYFRRNIDSMPPGLRQIFPNNAVNPAVGQLLAIFDAYKTNDAAAFNQAVAAYDKHIEGISPNDVDLDRVRFESFFNQAAPFFTSSWIYLIAFLLGLIGWLAWQPSLNRAALCLLGVGLIVHTLALVARIYITGKPPVTNLYSSAVFIGWGGVAAGMVLEAVYRRGVGNVVAGFAGFATLYVAHLLSMDGETMPVLQAVLDTQFWLATHVIVVTLGYVATFLAGLLGMLYVLQGHLTPWLTPYSRQEFARMIYGSLCFALFFSFFGTVLGGLWADDSWGRFWGWDPKENGALIIVLWNALVLHARWDAMVKDRGMAVLAIGGNLVTCWSWFGVNQLGIGLHSYGFSQAVWYAWIVPSVISLAVIAFGVLPKHMWLSHREHRA